MSDQHFTNIFNVSGTNNTINFTQSIENDSGGAEVVGMVLKFLLALLLSPILIPYLLTVNGVRLLQEERNGGGDYGDQ